MRLWLWGWLLWASLSLAPPLAGQALDVELRGHGGPVRALAMLPRDRLASAGFDGAIIVWDIRSGRAERVLRGHDGAINALAVRADGCLVSAGEDARIAAWCGAASAPSWLGAGHTGTIAALAVAPDGRSLASGAFDRSVRYWPHAGEARIVTEHAAPVTGVAFAADGTAVVSAAFDGEVRLTPLAGGVARSVRLPAPVNGIARAPDGHFLLAGADGAIREVDAELQPVRAIHLPDGPLMTVVISPDGRLVAAGGMRTPVTLAERETGRTRAVILGPGLPLWALAFAADGAELFSGGADRAIRRFDVASGRPIASAEPPSAAPVLPDPASRGAQVFRACRACHGLTAADANLAGPTLAGIMGRRIASLPGYGFSPALKALDIVWTPQTISRLFEVGPAAFTPGTKMPEQRITDPADRQALVEWLAQATAP